MSIDHILDKTGDARQSLTEDANVDVNGVEGMGHRFEVGPASAGPSLARSACRHRLAGEIASLYIDNRQGSITSTGRVA